MKAPAKDQPRKRTALRRERLGGANSADVVVQRQANEGTSGQGFTNNSSSKPEVWPGERQLRGRQSSNGDRWQTTSRLQGG
ncbi:hypothetical protein Scep_001729 [Stephania cephalantha]|uniref:Uncharacterized protein n=1 Tax=Stephania cephalantha TaxID=152367 RepID=A0AAP0Q491_9MAGN